MEGPEKGKPCFICQHNRHKGKGWRDVKLLLFPPGGFHLTDMGNARRLAAKYREDIRFVVEWGKWIFWNGLSWEEDRTGDVKRLARTIPADILKEAGQAGDEGLAEKIQKWAFSSESYYRQKALLEMARAEAGIPIWLQSLETNPWRLNVANGVLDLRQGEAVEPRREDFLIKKSQVAFDPQARCPRWLAFLREITAGDQDLVAFLQRAAGYSLTGSGEEQVWFFLYGNGRNGKSTFVNILAELAGDHYIKLPAEAFLQRRGMSGDRIPNGHRPTARPAAGHLGRD